MTNTVSVVIPVYNVEKYLEQCLNSITNQTYKDIEIICINDGSTDNSKKILEEFAAKDNRIKIITQENRGISSARNAGIKSAKGKYITFLDSDDYVNLDYIAKMVFAMENNHADFVISSAIAFAETDDDDERLQKIQEWLKLSVREEGLHNVDKKLPVTCWAQLFKTDILKKYNILFPEEKLAYEDEFWRYAHISHCKNFYYLPEKLYHYRIRSSSITGAELKTSQPLDIIKINELIVQEMQKHNKWKKYQNELEQMFCYHIHNAIIKSGRQFYPLAKEKIKELLKNDGLSEKFRNHVSQYIENEIPFSVIIPVYNVESYLAQCLDSIFAQTVDLFEVICVDDGSTDNSHKILKEYEKKYDNITIISQKNDGVSTARNRGLKEAKGQYILFIDSDDFIEPDLLETTYQKMQFDKLDWLLFALRHYNDKTQNYVYEKYYSLPEKFAPYTIFEGAEKIDAVIELPCECSNKVFRHSIITQNKIAFDEKIDVGEDQFFNINFLLFARKFGVLKKFFYNYRYPRKDSLCYEKQLRYNTRISLNFIDKLGNLILKQEDKTIQQALAVKYLRYTERTFSLPIKDIKKIYNELQKVLKNNKSILHLYKTTDTKTCETARYIIKHNFKQYKRKLKFEKIKHGKTFNKIKTIYNFIKAYLLFPWYIYQIYTNNRNNKAP